MGQDQGSIVFGRKGVGEAVSVRHQSLANPTGVASAVKHGHDDHFVPTYLVVHGEWKPLGEQSVVTKGLAVNAPVVGQRVNIRRK